MPFRLAIALVLVLTSAPAVTAQCPVAGTPGVPQISASSDLWDSVADFTVSGALPGAHWAWFADVTPGPMATPYGTFCFGSGALLVADSFSGVHSPVAPDGTAGFSAALTIPSIIGFPFYMQALVVDPGAAFNVARSESLPFTVTSPRLYVTSGFQSIDVLDARALITGSGTVVQDSFANAGNGHFDTSPDGNRMYVRGSSSVAVYCYDVTTSPATLLGQVNYAMTPPIRGGIALSSDGTDGYFLESSNLVQFDADPASPTFMSVTGTAALTNFGVQGLAVSADDTMVFVVAGNAPSPGNPSIMAVVDTGAMLEVQTIPLTDPSQLLLGFAIREPIRVSDDGGLVGTIIQGSDPFSGSGLNIVDTSSLAELAYVDLTGTSQADMAFSPDGSLVYTIDRDAGGAAYISVVDWAADSVTSVALGVNVTSTSNFEGTIDVSPSGQHIYVGLPGDDTVRVYGSGLNLIATHNLASNGSPFRVRVERR